MSINSDFKKASGKLKEVLAIKKDEVTRDSAIKRFEICFDLAWKSIKQYAVAEGVECFSPRECIKTAFRLKLIEYDELWLRMIDDRNKTAHLYHEGLADDVYSRLGDYQKEFDILIERIDKQ